ncbi:transcription factor TFIIIC complex protein [Malassezia pachydermatis]
MDIEQEDFTRLIHAFTDDPTHTKKGPSTAAKSSAWKQSMEAEMESFHHELRDVNGYARKHKATRIREQALSSEVKALLAQANIAYVEADLPSAIRQLEEVIRIEPTVKSAWYTLGMCFEEMGEEEKSIQCRIVGAHLTSNAADEWKSLARRSRERGLFQQSIYCLQQAIKKNRYDVDAIWDRAVMLKESGRLRAAADAFQAILKLQPYDAEVLRELIPLLVSLGEYDTGVQILEGMRKASMEGVQDPTIDPSLADEAPSHAHVQFTLNELVTLADLLLLLRRPLQVILVVKQTIRWLRGETRADSVDDAQNDLELDEEVQGHVPELDREVRLRLGKARFMLKDMDEGRRHFSILADETDPADYPVLFLEMSECYFEHQLYAEALDGYRALIDEGLVDDVSVWMHLGMCYQTLEMPKEAAHVYESILDECPDNFDVKLGLAEVYEELGERDKALDLVNQVMLARHQMREAPPEEAARTDTDTVDGASASLSFFNEANAAGSATSQSRTTRAGMSFADRQRLEQQCEEETRLAWVQLSALEPQVFVDGFWRHDFVFLDGPSTHTAWDAATQKRFAATRQWMQVAGRLIESFRSMSLLFPKERNTKYRGVVRPRKTRRSKPSDLDSQAEELMSRLRDHMVDEATQQTTEHDVAPEQTTFRTVHFDDWVALFMKYGIGLAKIGGDDEAIHDLFRHVMVSNTVWPSEERKTALHLCWLACAMYLRDAPRVFDIARWFPTTFQFHNEPLRLIASLANSLGFYGVDAFVSSTNTKQYQRRMRTHEAIVAGQPAKVNPRTGRWTIAGVDDEDDVGDESTLTLARAPAQVPPTKSSPIGEMFYGYLMLCANSYQPAMGYLLRALALQPTDPLLCLLCSVATLSRATNRQVDNRNHTVVQGLALLTQYADLRGAGPEVDYNFARAFHQLGLLHLAVPRYQRVLSQADTPCQTGFAMVREAAYNLSLIYVQAGSPHQAQHLYRTYLAV